MSRHVSPRRPAACARQPCDHKPPHETRTAIGRGPSLGGRLLSMVRASGSPLWSALQETGETRIESIRRRPLSRLGGHPHQPRRQVDHVAHGRELAALFGAHHAAESTARADTDARAQAVGLCAHTAAHRAGRPTVRTGR
eukprot:6068989-Prymnesium_polylepis.1